MVLTMHGFVAAQQQNGKTVARIVFNQELSEPENGLNSRSQSLKGALNALRQETQQLRSSTRKATGSSRSITPSPMRSERFERSQPSPRSQSSQWPTERPSTLAVLEDLRAPSSDEDVAMDGIDGIGNTEDIVKRIELLKQIYEQRRIENQSKVNKASLQLKAENTSLSEPLEPSEPQNKAASVVPPEVNPKAAEPRNSLSIADRVFPKPVDLFELGNSLYQTGELQTALEAYSQVDRGTITAAEAVWLDFMIASCQRRLGNWEEAESLYRSVANQAIAPNLSKPAQRWLKQLALVTEAKKSFQTMEPELSSLIEKANKHVQQ